MPRRCCVALCMSNHDSQEYITTYRFPKDPEQRERWRLSLPNVIKTVTDDMVVCIKHFPENEEFYRPNRSPHLIPKNPPSLFPEFSTTFLPQTHSG